MNPCYVLSPQAARDLVRIWRYIKFDASQETADHVEAVIQEKFAYLSNFPHAGHYRRDLTSSDVRFFAVYSYLIVYRPETKPLQVVAVLDGRRDVAAILPQRE